MHKGEDTEYYLKKGFNVVAFEADLDFVEQNKTKFKEEINNGRLAIVEGAIVEGGSNEQVRFYKNLDKSVWGTLDEERAKIVKKMDARVKEVRVDSVDFADCVTKYGMPYYMKIDIEGSDKVCLRALKSFDVKPCYLSFESEDREFDELIDEMDLLSELGYEKFAIVPQANMHKTKVPDSSNEGKTVAHTFLKGSSGLFGRDLRQEWRSKKEVLEEYKKIFKLYEKYGDSTVWHQSIFAKTLLRIVSIVIGRRIPGWYDIHAKHSSCKH